MNALHGQESRCFYSGTKTHPIYVDHVRPPQGAPGKMPIVAVHGGGPHG